MSLQLGTTSAQRIALESLPTTDANELHIGTRGGIVTISIDHDRRVPIVTTTLRTGDAMHIIAQCYCAVTGALPQIRVDTQGTSRLWVGNLRVAIPEPVAGLVQTWLIANTPTPTPKTRPLPADVQALATTLGSAAA